MEKEIKKYKSLKECAEDLQKTVQCNCDLDNWEPIKSTGHSLVCRIHKASLNIYRKI